MKKIIFLILICFQLSCKHNQWNSTTIGILPLGLNENQSFILNDIKKSIAENKDFKVILLPAVDLPKSAYYEPRKRYKADKILKHLKGIKPDSIDYLLAVTSSDISVKKNGSNDWGIFGLAYEPGKSCVVSLFRLGKGKVQLTKRVLKVTKHELGHNFGLKHCKNSKRCVMHAAEGSIKTIDRVHNSFCIKCKEKLAR
jgi:archaemetzincin